MRNLIIIMFFSMSLIFNQTRANELIEIHSNDAYDNVFSWWFFQNINQSPVPLHLNTFSLQNKSYNFHNPKYMQIQDESLIVIDLLVNKKNTELKVICFNQNGNQYSEFEFPWIYDLQRPIIFSQQSSNQLFSVSLDNSIIIFNNDGEILKKTKILEKYQFNSENIINVAPFNKNNNFLVSVTQPNLFNENSNQYLSHLLLLNSDGNVFLSKKFLGWQISSINASKNGEILAASMHSINHKKNNILFKSVIFDDQLNEIFISEKNHINSIILSKHSKIFFMGKQKSYLYDYLNNKLVNSFEVKSTNNIFVTGTAFDNSCKIAVMESEVVRKPANSPAPWAYEKPVINVIDIISGENINSKSFEEIIVYHASLVSFNNSNSFFLGHSKGWKQFIID